jgi:hypothetical protein
MNLIELDGYLDTMPLQYEKLKTGNTGFQK